MIGSSNLLIRLNQSSAAQVTVMLPNQCLVTGSPMAHRAGNQLIDAECNEALRDSPSYFSIHPFAQPLLIKRVAGMLKPIPADLRQ